MNRTHSTVNMTDVEGIAIRNWQPAEDFSSKFPISSCRLLIANYYPLPLQETTIEQTYSDYWWGRVHRFPLSR
jgi:hypothetical protein